MMLKVNDEYLEYNGDIEIERRAKLFEDISTVDGDFSYEFELQLTAHNVRVLAFPFADNQSKLVYQKIPAEVFSDNGESIAMGHIRIQRVGNNIAYCSFFSGNSNWFAMLTGNMDEIDLSEYEIDQTSANIQASWTQNEGVVFPIIDAGAMLERSFPVMKVEDFTPGVYVRDLLKKTFQSAGLKVDGELLSDYLFNQIVIFANSQSKNQIDIRTANIYKSTSDLLSADDQVKIIFDTDSPEPYFIGSNANITLSGSTYTADVKMNVSINVMATGVSGFLSFWAYRNGVKYRRVTKGQGTGTARITLEQGDTLELYAVTLPGLPGEYLTVTMEIKPVYVFAVFSDSVVPKWTKQQFISNVLKPFCCLTKYDPYSKTVTINLFDKIKEKDAVDLSDFINVTETDYADFISNYARVNNFQYDPGNEGEEFNKYRVENMFKYGSGQIVADNEHLEESKDVLESDFSSPISYINPATGASMERINFVELAENGEAEILAITNDSSLAIIEVSTLEFFEVGTLVRISDSPVQSYNGDWYIIDMDEFGGDYFIKVLGMPYDGNSTGKATAMIHQFTDEDNVYMMVHVPNYSVNDFSPINDIYIDVTPLNTAAVAYFNLINIGELINEQYTQGLSFGPVNDPLFYQRTLLEKYWGSFANILNDPVKITFVGHVPAYIHDQLDFLRPVRITTRESVNLYYLNAETGYKGSHLPFEGELIKL